MPYFNHYASRKGSIVVFSCRFSSYWSEQLPRKQRAAGSIPADGTIAAGSAYPARDPCGRRTALQNRTDPFAYIDRKGAFNIET